MSESAGGALTTDLPTFSLSPQEYITQVCPWDSCDKTHLYVYIVRVAFVLNLVLSVCKTCVLNVECHVTYGIAYIRNVFCLWNAVFSMLFHIYKTSDLHGISYVKHMVCIWNTMFYIVSALTDFCRLDNTS